LQISKRVDKHEDLLGLDGMVTQLTQASRLSLFEADVALQTGTVSSRGRKKKESVKRGRRLRREPRTVKSVWKAQVAVAGDEVKRSGEATNRKGRKGC